MQPQVILCIVGDEGAAPLGCSLEDGVVKAPFGALFLCRDGIVATLAQQRSDGDILVDEEISHGRYTTSIAFAASRASRTSRCCV